MSIPRSPLVALPVSLALALAACSDRAPPPPKQASAAPVAAPLPPRQSPAELLANAVAGIGGTKTAEGMTITLGGDRFTRGRAEFQPGDRIDSIAAVLKSNPDARVTIEGFTDSRGSEAVNRRLSEQRAESVKQALEERGVDAGRIVTSGRGSADAVASNDTAEGRAQNRRVELTFELGPDRLASAPSTMPTG